MNYLTKTSYKLVNEINEIENHLFKPRKYVIWILIIFLISYLSMIVIGIYKNSFLNVLTLVALGIATLSFVSLMYCSRKINKEIEELEINENFINKVSKKLLKKNLYKLELIEMIIEEINNNLKYHDERYNMFIKRCYKIFSNVLWIPLGVLLGALIGIDNNSMNIENFGFFLTLLVALTVYLILFSIILFPVNLSYLFHFEKGKKENAVRGLHDVKYKILKDKRKLDDEVLHLGDNLVSYYRGLCDAKNATQLNENEK